jgi:phospholysine phosphohistidine inorganic pyrophosphate phosphatase
VRNLIQATPIKALLFDMDGVLYNSGEPVPGAAEALAWVRQRGDLAAKLARFGIPATADQILIPAAAAATWLRERDGCAVALFVKPAARAEFEGIACLPDDAETGATHVVLGDLASGWDFRTLNRAFRLLHSNPDADLISLGATRYWQAENGLQLDVAPFTAALECATGRRAIVFGKPERRIFETAAEMLGVAPGEILMIGDDIEVDIGGAQRAGLKGALVRTGKFRPRDLEGAIKPDIVMDSVASLESLLG